LTQIRCETAIFLTETIKRKIIIVISSDQNTANNISYPASAAAVVFSGHLSAQAAFRLDRKSPAIRPCV
jgi:hypothetical protein